MSDQVSVQSPVEASIEERMAALVEPEEEQQEAAPQDNSEEAPEAEAESTPEEEPAETEEESAEPDLVEIEVDGQSYQVPEALKDKFMLQADYTRKTQEVAEQRKQVEQGWQQLQQQASLQQQNLAEYAQLMALDGQLQQYQTIDWNTLYDTDPAEFVRIKETRRDLIDHRNGLANKIGALQQKQQAEQQQSFARAVQEGQQILQKDIPNWGDTLAKTLNQYAMDKLGFTAEELATIVDPRVVKGMHKAYLYDQLKAGKTVTDKKVANLPKVSKPGGPAQKTIAQQNEATLRKNLKKSGSIDDAAALFLNRYK